MDLDLKGKTALIVGGSRGTGRAIGLTLAREGVKVGLLARDSAALANAKREIEAAGGEALALACDARDPIALATKVAELADTLGAPSILVLAAASFYRPTRLHNVPASDIDDFIALDLTSALHACRLVLPHMMLAKTGRIVALGSLAGSIGVAGGTAYAAAKAGLEGLVRGISVDYAKYGITANVIELSFVDSERFRKRMGDDADHRLRLEQATATKRIPSVDDVAGVTAFLCSGRAAIITGTTIQATAGAHLNSLV